MPWRRWVLLIIFLAAFEVLIPCPSILSLGTAIILSMLPLTVGSVHGHSDYTFSSITNTTRFDSDF